MIGVCGYGLVVRFDWCVFWCEICDCASCLGWMDQIFYWCGLELVGFDLLF